MFIPSFKLRSNKNSGKYVNFTYLDRWKLYFRLWQKHKCRNSLSLSRCLFFFFFKLKRSLPHVFCGRTMGFGSQNTKFCESVVRDPLWSNTEITLTMWHQLGDNRKVFCCRDLQLEYLLGHNGKLTTTSFVWKFINLSKLWEPTVVNNFCWIKTDYLVPKPELSLAINVFKCEWNTPGCNNEDFEVGYF